MALCILLAAAGSGAWGGCAQTAKCMDHEDCPYGTFCREGKCTAECALDEDCVYPDMICIRSRGYCRYPDAGVSDSSVEADGAQADAAVDAAADGHVPPVDSSAPDSTVEPDSSTTNGIYTDPCTAGQQCQSGFCLSDVRSSQKFCAGVCATDTSCVLAHECMLMGGESLCQSSDVGQPCSQPSECANDACIGNAQTGVGHCTKTCSSAADCPAGYACTNLSGTKYCVNVSMTCTSGMDCLTGLCLIDYGFPACTVPCVASTDCPKGYICDTDPYGNWYCVPPTMGTGGLGATCNGTTLTCQSGLCLGNYCTVECGVTRPVGQWCPPGFGCAPAGNGTDYFLVCSTAGTLGFGETCAAGNQCASALCREMSDATMECSRFCNDGVECPTGYTCSPIGIVASGVSLSVCDR